MPTKIASVLLVLALAAAASPAAALKASGADDAAASAPRVRHVAPERRVVRPARPRVQITPGHELRRECVDDTREVWRPYWGYVVTPGMRCWWVRQ